MKEKELNGWGWPHVVSSSFIRGFRVIRG